MGRILVEKGRLRTLSSDVESRKFTSQEETQRGVHIGCVVLCPIQRTMSISLGVGYRVAYPWQGNARALHRDKRSRAPTSFRITNY